MRYINKKVFLFLIILFLLAPPSCKETKKVTQEPTTGKISKPTTPTNKNEVTEEADDKDNTTEAEPEEPSGITIAQLNTQVGQEVNLKGNFWGWSGSKAGCQNELGTPPVTRSDWLLKLENGECIYMAGKTPEGMDNLKPKGEEVKISGTVKKTDKEQLYIELN